MEAAKEPKVDKAVKEPKVDDEEANAGKVEKELKINEVGEEDEEDLLSPDSFSLLYTAAYFSKTAFFAGLTIFLQGGMLLLTFLNLFDTSSEPNTTNDETNRMGIPAGATLTVTLSQFLGMLITSMVMASEGDFVIGITRIIKGYDPKILEQSPNASWIRWIFTAILQTLSGALLLLDSFILSMQSTSVIDLSLNLTALHFIQELDEKFFDIGSEGVISEGIQEDCEHVKSLKYNTTAESRRKFRLLQRILILLMTIALLVPYFLVVAWQTNGRFLCKNLHIQFGDAYYPELAHYSGRFTSQGNALRDRRNERTFYIDDTNTYQVAYCNSEGAWTVSALNGSPCDYLFKSSDTETFDVLEVANDDWQVFMVDTHDAKVDWLKIVCNECNEDTCRGGICSDTENKCVCDEGKFGVHCELEESCRYFALDQRTIAGLTSIPGSASFLKYEYESFVNLSLYGRPMYIPYTGSNVLSDQLDSYIIFTGRRWVMYAIPDKNQADIVAAYNRTSNFTRSEFVKYFEGQDSENYPLWTLKNLTADSINYFPQFYSSPVNYGEDSDKISPSTVTWMLAEEVDSNILPAVPNTEQPLSAKFLCTFCHPGEEDFCENGGFCGESYYCVCPQFFVGKKCERIKDCVDADGCNNAGDCLPETRQCACHEGSFGSLCQLGANKLEDEFFCNRGLCGESGHCEDSTFSQECTCSPGWEGEFCNETFTDDTSSTNIANNTE